MGRGVSALRIKPTVKRCLADAGARGDRVEAQPCPLLEIAEPIGDFLAEGRIGFRLRSTHETAPVNAGVRMPFREPCG